MIRAAALLLVLIPPIAAYFLGYDFARRNPDEHAACNHPAYRESKTRAGCARPGTPAPKVGQACKQAWAEYRRARPSRRDVGGAS